MENVGKNIMENISSGQILIFEDSSKQHWQLLLVILP